MYTMLSFRRVEKLMGNRFELTVVSDDGRYAEHCLDAAVAEISRIEAQLSTYREDSETNRINAAAGLHPVRVSDETFGLIERSIRISRITQGAFDITYGSIDRRFWNFDCTMDSLPDPATALNMTRLVNFRNIILDKKECTVMLKEAGMRIGFGGIGKGYAAEMAKRKLLALNIRSGIVNASGDLAVWGTQPDGSPWTVGIAHPDAAALPFATITMRDSAVATSGNYEKYVMIGGRKYSHTIDPKTGMPIQGIKSVTIFSPNAEICDALATPVTIMGVGAGLHLIDQLQDVECVMIDDNDILHCSRHIQLS
jgi:thiamine biosynthesis lipoprotein